MVTVIASGGAVAFADSQVSISGGDPAPLVWFGNPLGAGKPVVVGTFAPGFDPVRDLLPKYRVDDANNVSPEYYFNMVGAGDFRPIGETTTTGSGQFSGLFLAPDMETSRLWLIVWDSHKLGNSTLATSLKRNNWMTGQPGSSTQIDLAEADFAIFGEVVNGQLIMGVLPMPEPGPIALATVGVCSALFFRPSRRRDKDGSLRDSAPLA